MINTMNGYAFFGIVAKLILKTPQMVILATIEVVICVIAVTTRPKRL